MSQPLPLFTITHAIDWDDESTPDTIAPLAEPQLHGRERTTGRDPKGTAFRMFDDDGNLYFRGRFYGTADADWFAPLDWAMFDSGCTRIEYFETMPDGTRKWCVL